MSSLSDQQPGSPFSEYSDLCKVSSRSPTVPGQSWDWQRPAAMDIGTPRGLMVGDRPLAQTGLTDEDKLCFFEQPGRGSVGAELKVPGKVGGISGSPSLGNASLGSAGDSPDSPFSSSPSPSPVSPGRLPSALRCGGVSKGSLPPVPGSPVRRVELSSPTSAMASHSTSASLIETSPVDGNCPSEQWNSSSFAESSPKIAMPQVAPNYCVIGVVNDNHLERGGGDVSGGRAALGARQLSEGSSGDSSDEEEVEEEEEELEPCFMGRADQQRKAMRRAMSECSHLSVPTSLELPDKYPGGDEAGLDELASPMGGPRRSPHSMKRSLTVAEDQPQTPPPTLSAAGATRSDLRRTPSEPRLCLSPFPPLRESNAGSPPSPPEALMEDFRVEKETGGIVLPVPLSPKGFSGMDSGSSLTVGANVEGPAGTKSDMVKDLEFDRNKVDTKVHTAAGEDFGAGNSLTMAGGICDDFTTGAFTNLGLTSSTNPFITEDVKSDKMEMAEKKEENQGDHLKKMDQFDPLDKAEQRSVKVEYAISETPAKVEKEMEKEKQKDPEKEKEVKKEEEKVKVTEAEKGKETDKQAEKDEEIKKETEKGKETEKVEPMQHKEDKINKVEESPEKFVKTENVDKTEKVEKVEMADKVESKAQRADDVEKMDKNEKIIVEEKSDNKNTEKLEKPVMKDGTEEKMEKTPEQQPTSVKFDSSYDKMEKEADAGTKATAEAEETERDKADADKTKKTEKEDVVEKPSEEPAEKLTQKSSEKEEKQDQMQADKKTVEKKDDKKDKAAKADGGDKAKKAKPVANGSSATPSKDLAGADKKTKPVAGATKPSAAAAKMRLSSAAASGGSAAAPTKRPTTSSSAASASDKKAAAAKAPSTTIAGPKRPTNAPASRPSSATTARDVKPKTTTERRPLVPKASTATSNQTGPTAATKNGTATTAASKSSTSVRTTLSTRTTTTTTTAAKKPLGLAAKTNGKPGEEKKPSTLKTSAADSTKPKTTTTRSTGAAATTTASRTRTTAAKPATPSSTSGTVSEKKPAVPRAPRAATSTAATTTTTSSRTAARPGTAPAPDVRNVRSKIGSTDNMKHQPGGGKVPSASQNRGVASKETSQGKVQLVSKKLDFSHVTSRLGSKDNMKHVPGGGNVQILNKKVDLSKVTSKCGSKDNIKHKPGGGVVKIESRKVNFREKAQSKVGSMDNVSHSPGGGNTKAEGAQETTEGNGTPLSGTQAAAPGSEPGQAGSPAAQENGLKDGAPCDSESLREPQALDSSIPETSI
ncbi:microtubule-associated protein 4 isoform X10 [Scophthalmus maximus]|uniref:microtubule-associated protein 4 isoform X10 n=1 Tax=Scophthalmus maximus TaxID=52904 RepID=UPI001FA90950|nr:microtubule-associated protein 4 isoform X10 [Scophthalmus maximus]